MSCVPRRHSVPELYIVRILRCLASALGLWHNKPKVRNSWVPNPVNVRSKIPVLTLRLSSDELAWSLLVKFETAVTYSRQIPKLLPELIFHRHLLCFRLHRGDRLRSKPFDNSSDIRRSVRDFPLLNKQRWFRLSASRDCCRSFLNFANDALIDHRNLDPQLVDKLHQLFLLLSWLL